jgi:hypothetical protein
VKPEQEGKATQGNQARDMFDRDTMDYIFPKHLTDEDRKDLDTLQQYEMGEL